MKKPSHGDMRDDLARLASDEKTARLRALRLSKEAADREAAELSAAAKRAEIKSRRAPPAVPSRSRMPPPRLPKPEPIEPVGELCRLFTHWDLTVGTASGRFGFFGIVIRKRRGRQG